MEKPGTFSTIMAVLGTFVHLISVSAAQSVNEQYNADPADFSEAVGGFFALIIVIAVWWTFAFIALLFLLIGKLHRQRMWIVFLNLILCIGGWYFLGPVNLEIYDESTVELIRGSIGSLLPLIAATILTIIGLKNAIKK